MEPLLVEMFPLAVDSNTSSQFLFSVSKVQIGRWRIRENLRSTPTESLPSQKPISLVPSLTQLLPSTTTEHIHHRHLITLIRITTWIARMRRPHHTDIRTILIRDLIIMVVHLRSTTARDVSSSILNRCPTWLTRDPLWCHRCQWLMCRWVELLLCPASSTSSVGRCVEESHSFWPVSRRWRSSNHNKYDVV